MFFKFFLLLFVSANSYAIQGPLVEIANSYNEEYFWGHELGEAPILFQLDTVLQFDSKVALLQDNLKKLDQVDESLKSTQLYLDLKNFTEQTLFIMRTCQPGVWDYAEAYQLSHFFSKIPYYIENSNKLADTSVLEQSLNVLEKMLDIYNLTTHSQCNFFPS